MAALAEASPCLLVSPSPCLHSAAAAVLIRYRDSLRKCLLNECEELLEHDREVAEAQLQVREAERRREVCRLAAKRIGEDCEAIEASFQKLTGRVMPAFKANSE